MGVLDRYTPQDVFDYLQPNYDLGARILSHSLGSPSYWYNSLSTRVDAFVFEHPDALVLYAASNSGSIGSSYLGLGTISAQGHAKVSCCYSCCVQVGQHALTLRALESTERSHGRRKQLGSRGLLLPNDHRRQPD